ncbi:hypothetical protein O6P43_010180 [Quillaja saponaria]|uniref:Uncharacterized protein n=1 Tax=Quillaja saponaria TaxID=32244 RepID=A0AAD7PZX5_QUISA|nr:hypothetical protein O6P43_010180 [Quillaja saponaria]
MFHNASISSSFFCLLVLYLHVEFYYMWCWHRLSHPHLFPVAPIEEEMMDRYSTWVFYQVDFIFDFRAELK